jgi:hypothetical protein
MGKQSSLGPIDPQVRGVSAYGVIQESERAIKVERDDARWAGRVSSCGWNTGIPLAGEELQKISSASYATIPGCFTATCAARLVPPRGKADC